MNIPKICIDGTEYELSTKLRVAYKVQGQNGHRAYTEIFSEIGDMPIEKQIAVLYAAFEVANPDQAKFVTSQKFLDWYLDNYNVASIMDQLQDVMSGILGKDLKAQPEDGDSSGEQPSENSKEGN